jgi:uncharacterized membrane protein (TIGR01666 family)
MSRNNFIEIQQNHTRWRRAFWRYPDLLMAAKATIVMASVVIPLQAADLSFFAVTLSLGVLAGALSETDDHPKGRIKSLGLKVLSFGISTLSVELLQSWPLVLGAGLGLSTIFFLLVGGTGERYRGVTFGAILVGIYAMIGAEISPAWYWQPILLPGGALIYGILSLVLLYYRPYRLLDEQLGRGFRALAQYLEEKSKLFPSDKAIQKEVRARLALLNVDLVKTLDRIKDVLNSYRDALDNDKVLGPWFHYFMVLQGLHERAASTHERYDLLSSDPLNEEMMEITGQILHELSHAARNFAESLLTGPPFRLPVSLKWMIASLSGRLEKLNIDQSHPFRLLFNNLVSANAAFIGLINIPEQLVLPRLSRDDRSLWKKFKEQLSLQHPRMRYAIRLALCFWVGFSISEGLNINKGEWIVLTVLFVLQPSYSATRRRLFQRVLGTMTGVVTGVLIINLFTTSGQVLLMLASTYFFFAWLKKQYSVSVVFITIFVLCAFNLVSSQGVLVMAPRLTDTLIGSFLALGTIRLLWPQWQYKRLQGLLTDALKKNIRYFSVILEEYEKQNSQEDDLDYRIARRKAHQADNALAMAWQEMQAEPRRYSQFRQQAFKTTYLNHALLSFISAFGAHRQYARWDNSGMLVFGKQVLDILEENDAESGKKTGRLSIVIRDIQVCLQEGLPKLVQQQLVLLYNIADIGRQLLNQKI